MLVLSRQRDESVMINDDVEIRVVDVRGDKVRLGFVAPRSVAIHRKEIFDAIKRENTEAARLRPDDLPRLSPRPVTRGPVVVQQPDPLLDAALEQARLSLKEGGLPVGCCVASGETILAVGHDRRSQEGRPLAQAAMMALDRLSGPLPPDGVAALTSMPSLAAAAALVDAGVTRVVVGDSLNYSGTRRRDANVESMFRVAGVELIDRRDNRCIELLANFLRESSSRWPG